MHSCGERKAFRYMFSEKDSLTIVGLDPSEAEVLRGELSE